MLRLYNLAVHPCVHMPCEYSHATQLPTCTNHWMSSHSEIPSPVCASGKGTMLVAIRRTAPAAPAAPAAQGGLRSPTRVLSLMCVERQELPTPCVCALKEEGAPRESRYPEGVSV